MRPSGETRRLQHLAFEITWDASSTKPLSFSAFIERLFGTGENKGKKMGSRRIQ
jgi:hypothetical protein